jgi:hypothetical protein
MNFNEIWRGVNFALFMSSGKVHPPVVRNHQDGILVTASSGSKLLHGCWRVYLYLLEVIHISGSTITSDYHVYRMIANQHLFA